MNLALTTMAVCTLLSGCDRKRKVDDSMRVDVLDLAHSKITVPAGWNVATKSPPPAGAKLLVLDRAVKGFLPSIVVQDLTMKPAEHEMVKTATVEVCRDSFQMPLAAQQNVDPGFVRTFDAGTFRGCDYEVRDKDGPQAARQIAISNGLISVSFLCNRDKQPPPGVDVDAACEALARGITAK